MLPLTLVKAASGSPLLVELKDGFTYNGRLVSADAYMNMNLSTVICTSVDGSKFYKMPSAYIRGSAIKYLRLPDQVLESAVELSQKEEAQRQSEGRGGRGRGGRGGGRGRGGRFSGGRGRGRFDNNGRGGGGRGRGGGRGPPGGRNKSSNNDGGGRGGRAGR